MTLHSHWGHDNRPLILDRTVTSIGFSAAEGDELVADLPTGVRALQATSNSGSCVVVERSVRCSLGVLEPNEVAGARIVVEADAPGRFTVSIRVGASNDAEPANNQTSTELAISPNIDVSVDAMPDAVRVKLGRTSRVAISIRPASQPVTNVGVILSGISSTWWTPPLPRECVERSLNGPTTQSYARSVRCLRMRS